VLDEVVDCSQLVLGFRMQYNESDTNTFAGAGRSSRNYTRSTATVRYDSLQLI
jgi:hypothetical protein